MIDSADLVVNTLGVPRIDSPLGIRETDASPLRVRNIRLGSAPSFLAGVAQRNAQSRGAGPSRMLIYAWAPFVECADLLRTFHSGMEDLKSKRYSIPAQGQSDSTLSRRWPGNKDMLPTRCMSG
jgi:hypothetical protein